MHYVLLKGYSYIVVDTAFTNMKTMSMYTTLGECGLKTVG